MSLIDDSGEMRLISAQVTQAWSNLVDADDPTFNIGKSTFR